MPEGPTVEFVGLDDAYADMRRWVDQLGPTVERESRGFASDIASRVRGRVPVLTGTLASSVELVELASNEDGIGIGMGEGLDYAGWIEFGGSRGRPHIPEGRYLYPTALAAEGEYRRHAEQVAEQTVRSFPWSK